MSGPIFVHAGLPKTGTTYLQHVLWHNRPVLRDQGLLYPGGRPRRHFLAALDVQGLGFAGQDLPGTQGSWRQLVEEAGTWPGAVLLSHEMLARATGETVARIVTAFPSRPVHLVLTVRDLSRVVPATWQERAKNGHVETWREFVEGVSTGSRADSPHPFWHLQDTARLLEAWHHHVPAARIHLVTVPPPGGDPGLLLQRFCRVLGVDPGRLAEPESRANESVGAVEAALLQQVNARTGRCLEFTDYERVVKHQLVPQRLAGRADRVTFGLPEAARAWLQPELDRVLEQARRVGCEVEGDLADLGLGGLGGAPAEVDPGTVATAELLDRSVELLVAQAMDLDRSRQRTDRAQRELRRVRGEPPSLSARDALAAWARHASESSRLFASLLAARRRLLRVRRPGLLTRRRAGGDG